MKQASKRASKHQIATTYLRAGEARCQPEGIRVESFEDLQNELVLDETKIRESRSCSCLALRPSGPGVGKIL